MVFKIAGTPVTTTGSLAAGANVAVTAEVTVPAGQTPVTQSIFFRAFSPSSGTSDIKHDAVAVARVRSISITPNNTGQIFPNGTVTYQHTLENTGNVNEGDGTVSSIALTLANDTAGFTSVVYHDVNGNGLVDVGEPVVTNLDNIGPLAPGAQVKLLVRVFADNTVSVPLVNVTTITATTTNGTYTDAVPAVVSATDQSTVVEGDVTVTKLQALDAVAPFNSPDNPYQASNLTAPPGRVILYQIKVKNTGTGTVTAVVVSDTVPTHTTYLKDATYFAVTNVGTITAEPANGATGALTVTVGSLTSLQEATITFAVKVNE